VKYGLNVGATRGYITETLGKPGMTRKGDNGEDILVYSTDRSPLELQFYVKNGKITHVVWLFEN